MSTPVQSRGSVPTAGARRRRFALQTGVLLLAITFACVFAGVIGSSRRARAQFDLTGTRQHRLSERTEGILAALDGAYEIVVAGDMRSVDPLGRARTMDVLDAFARSSERVRLRVIDTSSSAGLREFDALLTDLANGHKAEIEAQRTTVESVAAAAETVAAGLEGRSEDLLKTREVVRDADANAGTLRTLLSDDAARCRVSADGLRRAAGAARTTLGESVAGTPVPAVDKAAIALTESLGGVANDLGTVTRRAEAMSRASDVPESVRERMRPILTDLLSLREAADAAWEKAARLPVLPIVAVARTLERSSAALIIGPPNEGGAAASIRAIEFGELFPAARAEVDAAGKAPSLDLRSRTEELVSTALAVLGSSRAGGAPIVVLVHDMPMKLAPGFRGFTGLVDRLRLRNMDVLEWPTALEPDPPAFARLDPAGTRPVVYATLSSAASDAESAMRTSRMANAMNRLVGDGENLLISVNVSTRPATRDLDPLVECLGPLGVIADTGRPLLRQVQGPNGRLVVPDHFTTETADAGSESAHLIARAVHGLRCHFPWPIGLSPAPGGGPAKATFSPVIQIVDNKDVWGESEWLAFAQMTPTDRALLANPPTKDAGPDSVTGTWTLVAAVEAPRPEVAGTQRAVVVGCAPWFMDDVTRVQLGVVDGRPVLRAPGNLELFEASVYWLAKQEQMIARSATAESVPLIPNLTEGQLGLIRWMLIAGLPVLVLLVGAGWRLVRG